MASSTVSSLTASDALAGTELFYADGLASAVAADVKVTSTQIKTWTSSSPTLVTPTIGVAIGTSLALNGVTLGTNKLAVAGTGLFNLNAASAPTGATGTGVQLVGTDSTVARFETDSFGAIGAFTIRRANGTGASPTALASSDQIGAFNFHGYYVTGGPGYSGVQASIGALATQNWTSTNQGTQILLRTTPDNSTTLTTAMTIGQDQSVAMAGTSTIATSLAIGGASIGTNALAVTGNVFLTTTSLIQFGSGSGSSSTINQNSGTLQIIGTGNVTTRFFNNSLDSLSLTGGQAQLISSFLGFTAGAFGSASDAVLSRNAAGIIQFGTNAANAAGSWLATNGTLSGGLSLLTSAAVTFTTDLRLQGGANTGYIDANTILLRNFAASGAALLAFGNTTSSFPAFKRSTTILQVRLADDSAYAPLEANTLRTATAYTVATLPAAGSAGRMAYVTDALAPSFLTTVVGGGAVIAPVFDNGTNWVGA